MAMTVIPACPSPESRSKSGAGFAGMTKMKSFTEPPNFRNTIVIEMTKMTTIRPVKMGIALLMLCLFFSGCAAMQMRKLGDQYAKEANWQEAHQAYSEGLKSDPHNRTLRQKSAEARAEAAKQHADRAKKMMEAGQTILALEEIKRALALEPGKTEWHTLAASALKRKEALDALTLGNKMSRNERYDEAITEIERALEVDPTLPGGKDALAAVVKKRHDQRQMTDSLSLKSRKPITLNFQNTKIKEIFETLEKLSGINILLDKDVRNDPISISAKDVSFVEALNMIFATNGLFMKRISNETILIAPDTKPKQGQYQDLMMRTFYLSHASAKEMVNLLRTMLETRHLVPNPEFNTILMRDTPEKIALAEKIIEANDRPQAEVMVNVEILEVKKTKGQKYGIRFDAPQVRGSVGEPGEKGDVPGISVQDLDAINNSNIFLILPSLVFDFFKQESEAQVLASPRVRVLDRGVAKIKVGDRVPILLSSSSSNSGSTTSNTTTTSIEFKDVGVDMTIEPSIHLDGDMTLKVNIAVTSLGDKINLGNNQEQFQFGNRSTETLLNVRDGETVVISGLLRDDNRETVVKIPVLGDIPYLGRLFSSTEKGKGKTDVMISITPQIIRAKEIPPKSLQSFWSGTEVAYSGQPLFNDLSAIDPDFPGPPELDRPGGPRLPGGGPPRPPIPGPPPIITFQPAEVTITPDAEVTISMQVNGAERLSSAHFLLGYDPAVLNVVRMTEGDFMKIDGGKTEFISSASPGGIDLDIKRVGDERGMTGSGALLNIVFKGVKAGSGKIQIRAASLVDASGQPLNAALSQAIVTVK
jgi:general secretion pathway protein D